MDIGNAFDDSLFESREKERNKNTLLGYSAKICESEWFMKVSETASQPDQRLNQLKMKADFLYSKKQYTKAAETYQRALDMLPKTNLTMKRDISESLAKSFLGLGGMGRALMTANNLLQDAINFDQKSCALNLLSQIYKTQSGNSKEEILTLKKCLTFHPLNPHYWIQLADALSKPANKIETNGKCSPEDTSAVMVGTSELTSNSVKASATPSTDCRHMPGSNDIQKSCGHLRCEVETIPTVTMLVNCLIRARLLLYSTWRSVQSFGKERNKQLQNDVTRRMDGLVNPETPLDHVIKFLSQDIYGQDEILKEVADKNAMEEISSEYFETNFDKKWFAVTMDDNNDLDI